jgi:hypothetical protein
VRVNTRGWFASDYEGEADLFLIYCPELERIYAVPVDEAPASHGYLRVDPTRNGQEEGIRWARDFELPA